MHVLTRNDYKLFCSLAQVDQVALRKTLYAFLSKKYDKIYATDDYLYAVGDIPIALCAHMDTVFKAPPKDIYYDREKNVMWSPTGLGADDRAGIFSIVKILQDGFKPTVIFCANEEKGGLGAEQLIKDYIDPISELNFIIELDRCNTNDCVFYDCANDDFIKYIEDFGFIEDWGTFSDISEICPAWGVAGVNLSIGYIDEHTTSEILHVGAMLATIKKVKNILQKKSDIFFKYIYNPRWFSGYDAYPTEFDDWYYDRLGSKMWDKGTHRCENCKLPFQNYELIPVYGKKKQIKYYCPDCCTDHVEWCYACGDPYEKGLLNEHGFCPSCAKKYDYLDIKKNKNKKK